MAIDHRILQNIGVSSNRPVLDFFNQAMAAQQQREGTEFRNQLLEMQTDLQRAQQPALLQQAERASDPLTQAITTQEDVRKFDLNNAQALKPFLDSGDVAGAANQLALQRQVTQSLVDQGKLPAGELNEIDLALQALQTPDGLNKVKSATDSFLQLGGVEAQQKSVGQQEREQALLTLKSDPKRKTLAGQEAAIFLGLDPKAGTRTGQERLGEDPNLTSKVAESQSEIAEQVQAAKSKVTTEAAGKTKALQVAVDFAKDANAKLSAIPETISTYKEAIEQLKKGANTGIVYNMLPSFDTAAMILDNISSQAGFNLAKSGGGIITEADMDWGMRTAIPQNLSPEDLKAFLQRKIESQEKILNNLQETVSFLGDGTKTLTDWYKLSESKGKTKRMTDDQLLKGF